MSPCTRMQQSSFIIVEIASDKGKVDIAIAE
jgi:hypothetical protein